MDAGQQPGAEAEGGNDVAASAPFTPTAKDRKTVADHVSYGTELPMIAQLIECQWDQFEVLFAKEIATAAAIANGKVAGALVRKALAGDTISQIFYLKTRGKWSEKIELGGNLSVNIVGNDANL